MDDLKSWVVVSGILFFAINILLSVTQLIVSFIDLFREEEESRFLSYFWRILNILSLLFAFWFQFSFNKWLENYVKKEEAKIAPPENPT